MSRWCGRGGTAVLRLLLAGVLVAARAPLPDDPSGKAFRVAEFTGRLRAYVPDRGKDGLYHPRGVLFVAASSDAVFQGRSAVIYAATDTDRTGRATNLSETGTFRFGPNLLRYESAHPINFIPTPIGGLHLTPMVDRITGGTGAFAGASGYLLLNAELRDGHVDGPISGVVILRRRGR